MAKYDISMIKDNNYYKEQCEHAEESLNKKWYSESILTMAITLEELTEELIKYTKNISDGKLSQRDKIWILKDNGITNYNIYNYLREANISRNKLVHGEIPRNYSNTFSMYKNFLKIVFWYDENYVIGKLNTKSKLKQYLNKVCDDSHILNIIEQEINDGAITENHQIIKRHNKELIDYVESLNIELEIKEKLIKDIYSGVTKNRSQIEEKIKREKKDPIIGVVNIVNTENMMKYTIQSTDIDKEVKENMEKLENNTHENKQLQEDYNKYGPESFTTETVNICKNEELSKITKEDEIIFNANKSYNNRKKDINPKIGIANIINTETLMKYTIQSTDLDKEIEENIGKLENNTHENKQLQEDYNKYGPESFTIETVNICKNEELSKILKEDEIIFNANKSYNNNKKEETGEKNHTL
ncbi:hypothetical protein mru_1811 [Methanobrevibacter ruminantium M1]|uniref:DUF4145 domain-containing protein n=1 Tax=Methanobrevibacter ruminantium (strain ATCC 35063 / DSM 1093 / JCM 13430 / OCM 146 / M1) TaxID=634498 RepID=D3DZI3_METRM|nr:hypothetical protein [Methanobrevibacter ruminantium]ADC47661.1 hypothetical protein mru_1811 [Methanobrevibacter ruminantium M1]